jgi:hypothetical protein
LGAAGDAGFGFTGVAGFGVVEAGGFEDFGAKDAGFSGAVRGAAMPEEGGVV